MAFTQLTTADLNAGKPVKESVMQQIKTNQDDHETRILAAEGALLNKYAESLFNVGIDASIVSNDLVLTLKQQTGSSLSSSNPASIAFRSSTQTSGQNAAISLTADITLTVPTGATLGNNQTSSAYYIYAINNAGAAELAISSALYVESSLRSTTAISSGSDAFVPLYSTSARSNVPLALLGVILATRDGSDNWSSVESVHVGKFFFPQNNTYLSSDINSSLNSTSELDVPNATLSSVVYISKPIKITLINHSTATTGTRLGCNGSPSFDQSATFKIYRSVAGAASWTQISQYFVDKGASAADNDIGSFVTYDTPPSSGLYDYKMTRTVAGSTPPFSVVIGRLMAINY